MPARLTVAPRICCVGGAVVDHYRDLGLVFPGGNACNTAAYAARSGAAVAFLGVVGDDPAGALLRHGLEAEGVDLSGLRTVRGRTPVVTVAGEGGGDFRCVACPRATLSPAWGGVDPPTGFDLVHLASTSRADAAVRAWAGGVALSYDFGEGPVDPGLASLVAVAAVSRPGMSDDAAAALAEEAQALGPSLVVVLRGAAGATAREGGEACHQRAAAAGVVDPLGAGDALVARLLVGWLSGEAVATALAAGSRAAARACAHLGGFGHGKPAAEGLPVGGGSASAGGEGDDVRPPGQDGDAGCGAHLP